MGTMTIQVPDDRPVHVYMGEGILALPAPRQAVTPEPAALPRRRRPILTALCGVAVLAVGFVMGQHTIASHAEAKAPPASAVNPSPPPVAQPFPQQGLPFTNPPASPASSGAQVPPALTQQLSQRPQVVPPPGAPQASARPKKNPFGLED